MTSTHVQVSNVGTLRIITFNNPKKNNALNKTAYLALTRALNEAAIDGTVNVVAITGAGTYYSSGNDLSAILLEDDLEAARETGLNIVRDMVQAFVRFPKLLVAVVNGPSIGIAATIIPLCDVAYASETVTIICFFFNSHPLNIRFHNTNRHTFIRHLRHWEFVLRPALRTRFHAYLAPAKLPKCCCSTINLPL